jgi:hypothetical protein
MTRVEPSIEDKIRALPDLMELEGAEGLLISENRMTPRLRSIIELRKRELKQALVVLACLLAMPADAQDTITIGGIYVNGAAQFGTTVSIEPSDKPGELAVVTLTNEHVNDGGDNAEYFVGIDGLAVGVTFTWDADGFSGADRITVSPPEGITCLPEDCSVTVLEGFVGTVVLLDWVGS